MEQADKRYVVKVPENLMLELEKSFRMGPIINDEGQHYLVEETVAHINGLKVEIFSNEHPPPHFRVCYNN